MGKEEFILNIIIAILSPIILSGLSKIFFIEPLKMHKEISKKITKLKNNFTDTNNRNKCDSMTIGIIEKQFNALKEILDMIDEIIETNKIFAFLFRYKELRMYVVILFEYNRNPIMLKEQKEFNDDYRMDINLVFKKIISIINFQKRVLMIFICLLVIVSIGSYFYNIERK